MIIIIIILGPSQRTEKLSNMKVMVIPIVISALGTVPKGLERRLEKIEIGGKIKSIQTTPLLRLTKIESLRPEETCCHSDSSERPSVNAGVKTCKKYNNDNK